MPRGFISRVFRHDPITLLPGVSPEDFERFMQNELMPFFSDRYGGPTRSSVADLKGQSFLKVARTSRKYLWVTIWDGTEDSARGASFENTRMIRMTATEAILKKLDALGKRGPEKIFREFAAVKVPTNK
ncbi:MAG: hypothetical protein ACKV2V_17810 [Blastocatellia bacterium]